MLTPIQTTALQSQITASGQSIAGISPNPVILKLFMTSLEYQHIHNYPQSGLNFTSDTGCSKKLDSIAYNYSYFSRIKHSSFSERLSCNVIGEICYRTSVCGRTGWADVLLLRYLLGQCSGMHVVLLLWRTEEN